MTKVRHPRKERNTVIVILRQAEKEDDRINITAKLDTGVNADMLSNEASEKLHTTIEERQKRLTKISGETIKILGKVSMKIIGFS